MRKITLCLIPILFVCLSCSEKSKDNRVLQTIEIGDFKEVAYSSVPFADSIKYVILDSDSKEKAFSNIDKIKYCCGKFYILDSHTRRILVYDEDGAFDFVLNRRGRSGQEYLQISDFTIDQKGDFWILDGQADKLVHYLPDGTFLSSEKVDIQCSSIECAGEGKLLCGIAAWDSSKEKKSKVVLTDTLMRVRSSFGDDNNERDPNFTFPTSWFSDASGKVYYNYPIDDNVCVFDADGGFLGLVAFDFGERTVPSEVCKSVERHLDELGNYSFLVKSIGVFDDKFVVGSLEEKESFNDFIIDLDNKLIYKQAAGAHGLFMVGISNGAILYSVIPGLGLEGYDVPEDILNAISEGKDVIAYLKL